MKPSTRKMKVECLTWNKADDELGEGHISNDHQRRKEPEISRVSQQQVDCPNRTIK
jgi:hypothetical protein